MLKGRVIDRAHVPFFSQKNKKPLRQKARFLAVFLALTRRVPAVFPPAPRLGSYGCRGRCAGLGREAEDHLAPRGREVPELLGDPQEVRQELREPRPVVALGPRGARGSEDDEGRGRDEPRDLVGEGVEVVGASLEAHDRADLTLRSHEELSDGHLFLDLLDHFRRRERVHGRVHELPVEAEPRLEGAPDRDVVGLQERPPSRQRARRAGFGEDLAQDLRGRLDRAIVLEAQAQEHHFARRDALVRLEDLVDRRELRANPRVEPGDDDWHAAITHEGLGSEHDVRRGLEAVTSPAELVARGQGRSELAEDTPQEHGVLLGAVAGSAREERLAVAEHAALDAEVAFARGRGTHEAALAAAVAGVRATDSVGQGLERSVVSDVAPHGGLLGEVVGEHLKRLIIGDVTGHRLLLAVEESVFELLKRYIG